MDITPKLRATRFAQLDPGDLFISYDDTGSYVAIAVTDPTNDGDKLALLLGPTCPQYLQFPALTSLRFNAPAISFGKDYLLRLPSSTTGWLAAEPSADRHCLVLTDDDELYIRSSYTTYDRRMLTCYIGLHNGLILTASSAFQSQYSRPRGICAYAVEWIFSTNEKEPRTILSLPLLGTR
jgi:hypothetical protein